MWVWAVVGAAVVVLYGLTTSTCHALVRPQYRNRSIMIAGVVVADEVRSRWRAATAGERERLAWAYYRLLTHGTPDRLLSFAEFRRYRRVVLAASVVLGRRWQARADPRCPRRWRSVAAEVAESLWFRLRVLGWPTLLLGRSGRGRLPRLPVRSRLRRGDPHHTCGWSYHSGRTPYACLGENGYRAGWYEHPVWDHEWTLVSAALTKAGGVWSGGTPAEGAPRPSVRRVPAVPDRAELEARQERRAEDLARLGDQLRQIAEDLIELADAHRPRPPVRQERDDSHPTDPSSSAPSAPGSSGRSDGGSHGADWGDGPDFHWD